MHNELLFKRGSEDCPGFKICVPRKNAVDIVMQQHSDMGHFGGLKTFMHMNLSFFWPKMKKCISHIVSTCDLCQKSKISKRCVLALNVVIAKRPKQLVCLDLMGPLPRGRAGVTQLLVIVDALSRYVKLFALKRATAQAITNRLSKDYFVNVGVPQAILSDNGRQFHSKHYQGSLEQFGVKVKYTSNYFPQGNIPEGTNREVGILLRAFCYQNHSAWAGKIKDVEHCLNNVVHSVTGYNLMYLHFGTSEGNNIKRILHFPETTDSHVAPNLNLVWELAREQMLSKADKRKFKHEVKNKITSFKEGEAVLVRTHLLSSAKNAEIKKLFLLHECPHYVAEVIGPNSYLIKKTLMARCWEDRASLI